MDLSKSSQNKKGSFQALNVSPIAEPDNDMGLGEDVAHHGHLRALLPIISLLDTLAISP